MEGGRSCPALSAPRWSPAPTPTPGGRERRSDLCRPIASPPPRSYLGPRCADEKQREDGSDQHQDQGNRGAVPELMKDECLLVDVEGEGHCLDPWADLRHGVDESEFGEVEDRH